MPGFIESFKIASTQELFTVEKSLPSDNLAEIASVINEAYKKAKFLKEGVEKITPSEVKDLIDHPHKELYLCKFSRGVCGTILVDYFNGNQAELGLFSIHPDYREYKIGPAFMGHVEQEAFKKAQEIILKVIPLHQERLIEFYKSLGYRVTGLTLPFPESQKVRYILPECQDQVCFSILSKYRS